MANLVTENDLRIASTYLEVLQEIFETLNSIDLITSRDVETAEAYQQILNEIAE